MPFRSTPGPGGFGPSPAFGRGHPGIKLQPAETHLVPGVHNGPAGLAGGHPWLAALVALLVAVAVAAVFAVRKR